MNKKNCKKKLNVKKELSLSEAFDLAITKRKGYITTMKDYAKSMAKTIYDQEARDIEKTVKTLENYNETQAKEKYSKYLNIEQELGRCSVFHYTKYDREKDDSKEVFLPQIEVIKYNASSGETLSSDFVVVEGFEFDDEIDAFKTALKLREMGVIC